LAKLRLVPEVFPKDVARRDVRRVQETSQLIGLRAFSCARRP